MKDGFPHQKIRLIDSFIFIHHPFTFFYQENIKVREVRCSYVTRLERPFHRNTKHYSTYTHKTTASCLFVNAMHDALLAPRLHSLTASLISDRVSIVQY